MAGGLRWTTEEDELFVRGLKTYGDGKWTRIAEMIGSRTALQVKNRARHVIEYESDSLLSRTLRDMRAFKGETVVKRQRRTGSPFEASDDDDSGKNIHSSFNSGHLLSYGRDDEVSSVTSIESGRMPVVRPVVLRVPPKTFGDDDDVDESTGDVQVEDEAAFDSEVDVDAAEGGEEEEDVFSPSLDKRRRKITKHGQEWVMPGDDHGRTITHHHHSHTHSSQPVRRSGRKQGIRPPSEGAWDHNPFRLVPLKPYGEMAPFQVIVAPQVLITMDFHAHMSVAEVIGLLGGRFDPIDRRLHVLSIFPCRSIGTRKECEMDPISEMEAVQQFASLDLEPVGWYHSHPTFEPSPSCRDIETQTMYQSLFMRDADNTEPFLGFIISPFLKTSKGKSVIECVHLASCNAQDEPFRLPCRVDYTIDDTGEDFQHPDDLVDLYEKLQLIYCRTSNYAGLFHEGYFINKLCSRLAGGSYEPSARALLQRYRNKLKEHL